MRFGGGQPAQGARDCSALRFLDDTQGGVEHDDSHNSSCFNVIAEQRETAAATINRMTRKLLNCAQSICHRVVGGASVS